MILKQWKLPMKFEKEQLTRIPVWAQFYNIPLEFWTEQGLSYMESAIGRPLYADGMTEASKRLSYAKTCIDVEANSTFPDTI